MFQLPDPNGNKEGEKHGVTGRQVKGAEKGGGGGVQARGKKNREHRSINIDKGAAVTSGQQGSDPGLPRAATQWGVSTNYNSRT